MTRRKTTRPPYHRHRRQRTPERFHQMTLQILPIMAVLAICSIVPASGQVNGQGSGQADGKRGALRTVCEEDYRRLCAGMAPGGGRIRKCMTENSAKLSPACKTALSAAGKPN